MGCISPSEVKKSNKNQSQPYIPGSYELASKS
jgi:hypothetical protein